MKNHSYTQYSNSLIFCILLLAMLLATPIEAESDYELVRHTLEPTIYGGAISPVDNFPYRILIDTFIANIVLNPETHNGSIHLEVGAIDATSVINLIVELAINVTEYNQQLQSGQISHDIIANTTLIANEVINLELDKIDEQNVAYLEDDNGTRIPVTSYKYYEMRTNATIETKMNIYLEVANHSSTWSSEVDTIELEGSIEYLSDPSFYESLEERIPGPLTITSMIIWTNWFILPIVVTSIVIAYIRKRIY